MVTDGGSGGGGGGGGGIHETRVTTGGCSLGQLAVSKRTNVIQEARLFNLYKDFIQC